MRRRSYRWLAPAACAVIGVVWVLWLAQENEFARDLASERAPPSRSALVQSDPSPQPAKDHVGSNPEVRDAGPASPAGEQGRPPSAQSVQFAFQTPANARIGEAFDMRVAIDARQPIGRIVLEIVYDPALIKVRSAEELDYSERTPGEQAFSIDQLSEGRVTVVMPIAARTTGEAPRVSAPVAQFEALAPGWARVSIANISVSDGTGRPHPWAATGRESQIAIN